MKRLLTGALSLALAASLLTLPAGAVGGSPSAWAQEEVEKAQAAGLVPALTGDYGDTITRGQFARLIVQNVETALGEELPAAPADTFTDTTDPAILKAAQAGIVTGVAQDRFSPDTATNREQIATMIARGVGYLEEHGGKDLTAQPGTVAGFADAGEVSDWALAAMGTLSANGIMGGTSPTTLSPKNPCTVEQSILLSWRTFACWQEAPTGTLPVPDSQEAYRQAVHSIVDKYGLITRDYDFQTVMDFSGTGLLEANTADLSGDGQDELICLWLQEETCVMAIYTYQNGQVLLQWQGESDWKGSYFFADVYRAAGRTYFAYSIGRHYADDILAYVDGKLTSAAAMGPYTPAEEQKIYAGGQAMGLYGEGMAQWDVYRVRLGFPAGASSQPLDLLHFVAALTLSATDQSVLDRWGLA